MPAIHPTALVDPAASLADDVTVGPFAIVEAGVTLAAGCRVEAQAQILTGSVIGEGTKIGRGAVIGGDPQSLGFDPTLRSGVRIGRHNILREYVTIHRSLYEGKETVLGDANYLMVGAHVGHDSVVGNFNVLANAVLVAGHVEIGSRCFLGGGTAYHQFIRVGDMAMAQGNSAHSCDIPPYSVVSGVNILNGLNIVGMRRAGFSAAVRSEIKRAFDLLFVGGMNLTQAVTAARKQSWGPEADVLIKFVESRGNRGMATMPT